MKSYFLQKIDDNFWKKVKVLAANQETTIKDLIIKGLEKQLSEYDKK